MAMNEQDRGQFADVALAFEPGDAMTDELMTEELRKWAVVCHPDQEEQLLRVLAANDALRDRINLIVQGEVASFGIVENFRVVVSPYLPVARTMKGKRVAQWKTEQRRGRR